MEKRPESITSEEIERKLWKLADEVSEERERLSNDINMLYDEISKLRVNPNLHDSEIIISKENDYWNLQLKLALLTNKDDEIQDKLIAAAEGKLDDQVIEKLFPKPDQPKISKRKRRILEERERDRQLARQSLDPDTLDYLDKFDLDPLHYVQRSSHDEHNPNRLTSGKRATRIKGNMSTFEGAGRFYDATVDTHGGKVRRRGSFHGYVGRGGRKIRKK